jgi:hypothetical protein
MLDAILTATRSARASLTLYRGGLRRLRPTVLDTHTALRIEERERESDALRLLLKNDAERARLFADVRAGFDTTRRRAAAGARSEATKAAGEAIRAGRAFIAARRADVLLSMPRADENVSADGMLIRELLRLQLAASLSTAPAAQLAEQYARALARKAAPDLVIVEVIEHLTDTRAPLALTTADRAAAQRLREHVDGIRDLRVPLGVPDFDALAADLARLHQRADLLNVHAIDPAAHLSVREALDAERLAMTAAGEADDAEDQQALRELTAGRARR